MNYTYLHFQTAIALLTGIGPRKARALMSFIPSPEMLFKLSYRELAELTGLKPSFFQRMQRDKALELADKIISFHEKKGISSIYYQNTAYSRRLNQCADAPIQLYMEGCADLNSSRFVSVVGTRSATEYGRRICKELIASFEGQDIIVVSGLALGIDSYVHRYCLEYNVPTIGVLGHGMDRMYPHENRSLAKNMIETGALLTEFIPGTRPDRENFPKRNRIVAGLSDVTIVVESKASGGSLITAQIANSYNRDVFAFPGPVYTDTSQGCNALISQSKAHLLEDPGQFLEVMNWSRNEKTTKTQFEFFPQLSEDQQEIAREISDSPNIQIDVLAAKLAIPISRLQVELLQLKLNGIVEEAAGKRFQLV